MFNHSDLVPRWTLIVPLCCRVGSPSRYVHGFPCLCVLSVCFCLYSPIFVQSARNGTSNNMSRPKMAAPGEVFSTGRANGPCSICEKVCYVTLSDCFSHIYFTCAEHRHDHLMHSLENCIRLRILDAGWLMFLTICFTEGLKVKFKFTFVVVDDVLATRVSTTPGPVY